MKDYERVLELCGTKCVMSVTCRTHNSGWLKLPVIRRTLGSKPLRPSSHPLSSHPLPHPQLILSILQHAQGGKSKKPFRHPHDVEAVVINVGHRNPGRWAAAPCLGLGHPRVAYCRSPAQRDRFLCSQYRRRHRLAFVYRLLGLAPSSAAGCLGPVWVPEPLREIQPRSFLFLNRQPHLKAPYQSFA